MPDDGAKRGGELVFDSIGWGEIVVLGLAALFIFGPERLPSLAKDAASGIKRVREAVTGVRGQLHESLGEDFDQLKDLDLRQYSPKTFIRKQLMDDEPPPTRRTPVKAAAAAGAVSGRVKRDRSAPPPFDLDAT